MCSCKLYMCTNEVDKMFEFWKNEWKLFLEDLDAVKNAFGRIFGRKQDYLMLKSGNPEEGVTYILNVVADWVNLFDGNENPYDIEVDGETVTIIIRK